MAKKGKVEISGGMSPTFISRIAKSAPVNRQVKESYEAVKKKLEAKASAKTPLKGRRTGKHHYGSKMKRGAWGTTWILWAITPTAKNNTRWFKTAISTVKNVYKRK